MITVNPVRLNNNYTTYNKKYMSFGDSQLNNLNSKVGVMSLDKKPNAKIIFEKDLHETRKADMVQSNPIKALGYNIAKAYNILCTPKRRATQAESTYVHIPYMA